MAQPNQRRMVDREVAKARGRFEALARESELSIVR